MSTLDKITSNTTILKLQENVSSVVLAEQLQGFEKAYLIASAAGELKKLLNDEYMKPIMALQGNRLGFKTDKDRENGYSIDVVKNCLIEAVLMGVQPCGNQFNIIVGNCYLTKEGLGYLLKKIPGLSYDLVFSLPRINADKSGAAIFVKITWSINGNQQIKDIEIPVKMNAAMGTDAVIGKATRKARKWLYDTITGSELPDGDDTEFTYVETENNTPKANKETERVALMITDCQTLDELKSIEPNVPDELVDLFNSRLEELRGK